MSNHKNTTVRQGDKHHSNVQLFTNFPQWKIMDFSFQASLPLLGVSFLTILISLCFCCYLWRLKRQGRLELGYKQIGYSKRKVPNETCPVCLDDFVQKDRVALCPCKHAFHCKCLEEWLKHNNSCPMCKAVIRPDPQPGESSSLVHFSEESV